MIDLHCHLLPGIDDGSKDLAMSLEMARIACDQGISTIVCTPHITPGIYDNTGPQIKADVASLQQQISFANLPLKLLSGADVHLAPDLLKGLGSGRVITLAGSRYLLLEPPSHTLPPQFDQTVFQLQTAGYVPVLTHPERMPWMEAQFSVIRDLVHHGVWLQVTAGSLTGRFGRRAQDWGVRLLDEGLCHLVATDAHDPSTRPPHLAGARSIVEQRVGTIEASSRLRDQTAGGCG